MIAANTIIMDFDGHSAWPPESRWTDAGAVKPITIEEDVWIGMNCVILKGVTIGKGAIVGPNSVVIHDIEPGCLYAGNPAKKIKDYTQ
ncbi:MAG: acyltransferase [Betaproteobacteria bacterium]|nr:acyltransferase [Betaproteobacteria bacterium]